MTMLKKPVFFRNAWAWVSSSWESRSWAGISCFPRKRTQTLKYS